MNRRQRRHEENHERRQRQEKRIVALEDALSFMRGRQKLGACICGEVHPIREGVYTPKECQWLQTMVSATGQWW
jgi:hypothetical protein